MTVPLDIEELAAAGRDLPRGWRWARLATVLEEAQGGFASGNRAQDGVIQLRMNNVTPSGKFDWTSYIRVPADEGTVRRYALRPGDVLFNNTNSTELVGKSALFNGHEEPVVFSNHFTRIRTTKLLDPSYLALWLQAQWCAKVFQRICNRWIGQSAVQRDKLLSLEMVLPPLADQRRIAAVLTDRLAAVDRLRAVAEARLAATETLPNACLRAVFDSDDAWRWPKRRLAEVGALLPSKSTATAGDTEITAITTACLSESGFQPAGVKRARMWAADVAECVVRPGEVLIARSNTEELVGRAAVFAGVPSGAVASDLTIRYWPGESVEADFLGAFLSHLYLTGYWKARAGGASGSMKKITRTHILDLPAPVPPLAEQRRIAGALTRQRSLAAHAAAALHGGLDAINALPAALLRDAFSGKL